MWREVVLAVGVVFAIIITSLILVSIAEPQWQRQRDERRKFGAESYHAGATSEANPYMTVSDKIQWLRGWNEAANSDQ